MVNQNQKEYERQKKIFHSNPFNYNKEMSHTWGKNGYLLGCARFIKAGIRFHHKKENQWWIKEQRELTTIEKLWADKNYIKGIGCKDSIFEECRDCLIRKAYMDINSKAELSTKKS